MTLPQIFDLHVRTVFGRSKNDVRVPPHHDGKTVYDYFVDLDSGAYAPWTDHVPEKYCPPPAEQIELFTKDETWIVSNLLPTADVKRALLIVSLFAKQRRPVLLYGVSGTAKTRLVNDWLAQLCRRDDPVDMDQFIAKALNKKSNQVARALSARFKDQAGSGWMASSLVCMPSTGAQDIQSGLKNMSNKRLQIRPQQSRDKVSVVVVIVCYDDKLLGSQIPAFSLPAFSSCVSLCHA